MRKLSVLGGFFKTTLALAAPTTVLGIAFISSAVVLTAVVPAAASSIVFNNFGPNDSYGYSGDWIGRVAGADPENLLAGDFIPSSSGKFNEVWTAMFHESGLNEVTLALLTDSSGSPGSVIWQQTLDNQLGNDYGSVLHVANIDGPMLTAGTRYWIQASTPDIVGTLQAWYFNDQGDVGLYSRVEAGRLWVFSDEPRLTVRVGVVPEPSALALLGVGAVSLFAYAWRRRRS